MIYLVQNVQKNVSLTLTELSNVANPSNWLFVFELEQNEGDIYKKQFVDISEFPESYNRFSITPGEVGFVGADIEFEIEGDYRYKVYQMPDAISTDETLGLLVESGKMNLSIVEDAIPTFTVNTDAKINKIDTAV